MFGERKFQDGVKFYREAVQLERQLVAKGGSRKKVCLSCDMRSGKVWCLLVAYVHYPWTKDWNMGIWMPISPIVTSYRS